MKLITASLRAALIVLALAFGAGPVLAGAPAGGPCCVCTSCTFSEHCFTGLTASDSVRCTQLCGEVNCSAGAIEAGACETFAPLCEVITPAPAATRPAPAMHPLGLALAIVGMALVGVLRLVRAHSAKATPLD